MFFYEVRPGISAFNSEDKTLDDLDPYMDDLLQEARDYVPESQHKSTSIYVMATAGTYVFTLRHLGYVITVRRLDYVF